MDKVTKVIVVDDEPDIVKIVKITMELAGFEVQGASSGEECLEKLGKHYAPELILLDLMMPGMSGYETCAKIKADKGLKDIKIIMLTAKGQTGDAEEGLKAGADAYIIKPFDPYELISQIKEVLAR